MQAISVGDALTRFLAQSKHNPGYYTLKVYEKAKIVHQKMVQRVYDERAVLRESEHPFVVHCYGTLQDPRNLYMVMDFAPGGSRRAQVRELQGKY